MMKKGIAVLLAILLLGTLPVFGYAAEVGDTQTDANGTQTADPGEDPADDSGEEPGKEPGEEPGKEPGENPEEEPGTEPSDEPGSDIPGDADADGAVTAADARLILRFAVSLDSPAPWQTAVSDLDGDKTVTAADARIALRFSVGLPMGETEAERAKREERERKERERKEREERERREKEERERKEKEERERIERLRSTKEGYMQLLSEAVSEEKLSSSMQTLVQDLSARAIGTAQNRRAADWIVNSLKSYGFSDIRRWKFTYEGAETENLIGVIPTKTKNPDIMLFVAHYDTVSTTGGAVDNSSGVALMLELSRILMAEKRDFGREVRFLFSSAEELGYVGCYRYISYVGSSAGSPETLSRHTFVFNVDMGGRTKSGGPWHIAVSTESCYGSNAKPNWGSNAVDHAKNLLGDLGEDRYYSPVAAGQTDIVPFRKYGLPCVNVSWRTVNAARSHGSDYDLASPSLIHTWDDNLDHFDMPSLYAMTRLVCAAAGDMLY